ncbi:MAG: hypothetical protein AAFY15_06325, partial [Cyanobacteria bacterium J06648_11]
VINLAATLDLISSLSIEERFLLVQAMWDGIAAEYAYPTSSDRPDQNISTVATIMQTSLKP